MLGSKGKISIRQAMLLFIVTTMSPAIRLFPQYAAQAAGKAGWLAPVVAAVPMTLLILTVSAFFKNNQGKNLSEIYCDILGNIAGKIVVFIYLVWILVLIALYTRYYSERILSSMLPHTSSTFIIIVMILLVIIASRKGLVAVVRANEIFFAVLIAIFVLSFLFSISQIKYRNLMSLSYLDTWPVIKSSLDVFVIWGYFLFVFFFAERINGTEKIKKLGFRSLSYVLVLGMLILLMAIGSLGSRLASHVSLPYFMTVKNISILETIDHIESAVLSIWLISDFVILTLLTASSAYIMKSMFKLSEARSIVTPILIFAGVASLYFFDNRFELEAFSNNIAVPVNAVLEFIFPFIIFGIGKLRKKI